MSEAAEAKQEVDILDVPDDEVDKYAPDMAAEEVVEDTATDESTEADEDETEETEEVENTEESDTSDEPDTTESADTQETEESTDTVDTKDTADASQGIDYKLAYEQLTAPFKANGREMQVNNVEDALTLMKMGANYNKKMAALKPHLKVAKLLEKHDLLDEEKLSYLIDLHQKNPNAISKLIKDSGVDPLEFDTEQAEQYKPNIYTVNEKEVELDAILDELKDTTSFNTTADIISNKWDAKSKQVLVDNPALIRVINDHVESGIYAQISTVVERERMLGRLNGLSDIEAYKYVGDAINAAGGFANQQTEPASTSVASNIKATNVDPSLNKRKKAASSTKSVKTKKVSEDFNPLSLSDEEFEKIASSKFI